VTKRRLAAGAVALLVLVVCGSAAALLRARRSATDVRYYLALGDSLSTGYQPTPSGGGAETSAGYVTDIYAYEHRYVKHLALIDLGCPGDTTGSLLTGSGNTTLASRLQCDRSGGSQLAAARAFLQAHNRPGEVPLITVDIGINDLNRCADAAAPAECLAKGERSITANTPKILNALAAAAPKRTTLAQMNLYDTHLGRRPQTREAGASERRDFIDATLEANATIDADDRDAGFRTADIAAAFHSYDQTMTTWNHLSVPVNVARACILTWACSRAPIGHNIHPNRRGYRVIARAFEGVIGKL
jgi:lysophospholipase L1-like esterase